MKNFTIWKLKYLFLINTLTMVCIFFFTTVTAQKQYISGKGTQNFSDVKKARTAKKPPLYLAEKPAKFQHGINKKQNFRQKRMSMLNAAKHSGKDSTYIYLDFYNYCYYCYDSSCYTTGVTILFSPYIWTNYPQDTSDISVTIDFGDGTNTTFHPYHLYYFDSLYYDSTEFIAFALHAYSLPGIYTPTCTVITSTGDTATQSYSDPITVISGTPPPPSITYFDSYNDQYCWNDSLYYYGTYNYLGFYYPSLQSFSDIFTVNINYGDGNDTTFLLSYFNQYWWYWYWYYTCPPDFSFYDYPGHSYSQSGTYTVSCSITFPDGAVATESSVIYVADHCVTIGGKVFIDNNANCIPDAGEAGVPDVWLYIPIYDDSIYYNDPCYYYMNDWTYTDSAGDYSFSFPDNCPVNDTIMFYPYYNYYPVMNLPLSCPTSGYYVFNTSSPSLNYDFALGCTSGYDLQGFLWGWRFRPGFQGYIFPMFGNYQCDSVSGTATLIIDNPGFLTIDSVIPSPSAINGDTIIWNFSDISILDWWNYTTVYITTDTSANDGDTIHTTLILEPISGDANPSNNIITEDFIVSNSWDPNEKETLPKSDTPEGFIHSNDMLTYIIHFQNTGSDTAYNIYVTDTIDANLDMGTMKVLTSSHYMEYFKDGNIVTFSFPYIMLPDSTKNLAGSQGFVSYSIKPKSALAEGTEINNTAFIFFDYNPAVVTNTTLNTISYFAGVSTNNANMEKGVTVYPNPAKTELFVQFKALSDNAEITLYDIVGKQVYSQTVNSNLMRISVTNLSDGLYFLQVKNAENTVTYKVAVLSEKK